MFNIIYSWYKLREESKFTILIGSPYATYSVAVNQENFVDEFKRLRLFMRNNGKKVQELAREILEIHRKTDEKQVLKKPIHCRVPKWFHPDNVDVAGAIALILYFVDNPLTTRQITQVMNEQFKKIDLRNVSKPLTSKTSDLYAYTTYDHNTSTYSLSNYGKQWLETELLSTIKENLRNRIKKKRKKVYMK